jgi:hypothetical protein
LLRLKQEQKDVAADFSKQKRYQSAPWHGMPWFGIAESGTGLAFLTSFDIHLLFYVLEHSNDIQAH